MSFEIPSDEIGFDTDGAIAFEAADTAADFSVSQDSPRISTEGSGGWEIGEYIRARDSEYPDYAGPYAADARFQDQTFATNAKVMRDDFTVRAINYTEAPNDSGVTVTIGG